MSQLLILQQLLVNKRYGLTKQEIARTLGKSSRQVERYLKQLKEAGVPLVADGSEKDGVARRWKIDRSGYVGMLPSESPPLELNATEFFILMSALETVQLPQCEALDQSREALQQKIALFYKPMQSIYRPHVLTDAIVNKGVQSGKQDPIAKEVFEAIMEGSVRHRRVKIAYPWRQDAPREKLIDPMGIIISHGSLYCLARVERNKDLRMLKLSRITKANVTESEFDPPKGFSLKQYLADNFELWNEPPQKVKVRFYNEAVKEALLLYIHPTQKMRKQKDGSLDLTFTAGGKWEIIRWILSWGADAELLEPGKWRENLHSEIEVLSKRYLIKS